MTQFLLKEFTLNDDRQQNIVLIYDSTISATVKKQNKKLPYRKAVYIHCYQ